MSMVVNALMRTPNSDWFEAFLANKVSMKEACHFCTGGISHLNRALPILISGDFDDIVQGVSVS